MASIPGDVFTTYQQSEAIKTKAAIDKQQFEINQELAEYKAEDALERGKEDEDNFRKQIRKVIGSQRAALGASGIELASGSALELQEDAATIGEIDALTIRQNARMEAFGHKLEALNIGTQSSINAASARSQGAATLLTGGLKVGGAIGAFAVGGAGGGASAGRSANAIGGTRRVGTLGPTSGTGRNFNTTRRTA